MYRISTDVGGTFTDGILLDESTGRIAFSKVLSTPSNPAIGTMKGIEKFGVSLSEVSFLAHGTTVVINALIEGKGAKTALITTKGFRDVLEIGRSNRTEMYDALYRKPRPIVPRHLRLEVKERMDSSGRILIPLELKQLDQIIAYFKQQGVGAVAVCFLNSYCNPVHEEAAGKYLEERLPGVTISLSHRITRRYYEYERTSTTVQNAYVMPVIHSYLESLESSLKKKHLQPELQIMQSNGGIMTSSVAKEMPIGMVESGPAAGAIGGAQLANLIGCANVITYDMGGTTAKSSIIKNGQAETVDVYMVEGRPILLPVVDLKEIGAGGGSIAWIDEGGALHVGPQSAGASPGPACYMLGGTAPTVTDANLHLGILHPQYFLGGEMEISPDLAAQSLDKIANYFHISRDEAALGIIKIVNTNMAGLLQSISVKRGYDPRDFSMVAFGGAGPIHAVAIAKELRIPKVIVPMYPGAFSAWGMLMADLRHDFNQTYIRLVEKADPEEIQRLFRVLEAQLVDLFEKEKIPPQQRVILHELDLRYYGQEHTLAVPSSLLFDEGEKAKICSSFDEQHLRIYGHNAPEEPKEIVTLKVVGLGKVGKPFLPEITRGEINPAREAEIAQRSVYQGNGERVNFRIFRRDLLAAGNQIRGPAIIEEQTATTVVEPDQLCEVDRYGNLIIQL